MPGPVDSEALTFVEVGATLWSKDTGEFRTGSSSSMEHKLSGQHVWPFTLELPAAVTLPATRYFSAGTFALPQTFLERRVQTSVQYSLLVSIIRSRFRVNSKQVFFHPSLHYDLQASRRIETTFSYIPSTRPPPPSPLRQLAYRENRPLLGPEVDLDGWVSRFSYDFSSPLKHVSGTIAALHSQRYRVQQSKRRGNMQCAFYQRSLPEVTNALLVITSHTGKFPSHKKGRKYYS
jgi:hypothetical protein